MESGNASKKLEPGSIFDFIALAIVISICVISNYKSMNCFFFADDFLCLDYLYKIFHGQPVLLLQRLISPWQDRSFSLLFRPFLDLLFSADYLFWGKNAFGYHLTNLLLLCSTTSLLYFTIKRVSGGLNKPSPQVIAALSAAAFAAYPLHVEPLVWLVGRADLAAALFILAAFIFSMKDIERGKPAGPAAILCYSLALLSKEAAACMPAIVFSYVLILEDSKNSISKAIKTVVPLLVCTIFYLLLRFFVLGTFLGGYTGSLGELLSYHWWTRIDFDMYSILGLGVNLSIFTQHSPEVIFLQSIYLMMAAIMVLRIPLYPWDTTTARLLAVFRHGNGSFSFTCFAGNRSDKFVSKLQSLFFGQRLLHSIYRHISSIDSEQKYLKAEDNPHA